ncbi:MAG: endolytic transglycosylase MltG [Anaerolineales bacterium]|nr:endolytic transglycosylase MltG [Anaerolineales bacterium]
MRTLIALGFVTLLAFLAFLGGSTLLARAESLFGPPSPALNAFQRVRIGMELGWRAEALRRPVDPAAVPAPFIIPQGEATRQIVSHLWEDNLIHEGQLFSNYLFYTGKDTQLQAGTFQLSAAMSAVEIAEALLDPTPEHVTLVILPGWRLEEIAASLPSAGVNVPPEEFVRLASSTPNDLALYAEMPIGSTLEGFLLPGNYEIPREAGAIDLLLTLLDSEVFSAQMTPELVAGFQAQGLSIYDALILASIVERESVIASEMPLIASVFHNRLDIGMKLQADPTVQYAVGYDDRGQWWPSPLTAADLQFDSPYNTYLYAGLPPSPIAAPSAGALQAVAFPAASPYYYFQAACDGSGAHMFAVTYEEHLTNNCH